MKSHNYNYPKGTDSAGPYWLNPETGEKLRWNGPMVGESNIYPSTIQTPMQKLIDKVEHAISYNIEGGLVEKYTWTDFSNDMYALLEKEKLEMIQFGIDLVKKDGSKTGTDILFDEAVELYNKKYQTNNL